MRNHAILSYKTLLKFPQFNSIALYVKYHHERIDGKGYPEGLKGDEIPFFSRIISVVDAFEAMTSDRPYKKAMTQKEAIAELIKNSGTQFDKNIVKTFINNVLENK
ncbi:MAG: HD domain-containing phosphohydrolase [Acholeplasma sp.]|nr:HD domain-containing phosphohydrolase [Acholeplasma sp.]